jgi:tRNA nucleotidyltransferase/poly(A) polymerase
MEQPVRRAESRESGALRSVQVALDVLRYCFAASWMARCKRNNIRDLEAFLQCGSRNGMPDYIYLLENRLSIDQQNALRHLREAAREAGMLLFLTGDAVRDLTSGHAVRDLEVAVQGNALKLKKSIEKFGAKTWGEDDVAHTLYLCFPGTVRVDLVSTHGREYPKPGKPVFHWTSIQEDLRRRDFTVNAMALSLNEGSFGLLMDPLNGAADIEARTLRLVSNYGFLEEPALLVRATRYLARLGWELDPRTHQRYENAKAENVMEYLSAHDRSQELEQIGHEDDGFKVLQALEAEGWMKILFPAWTHTKAEEEKLKILHDKRVELQVQGVHPDMSAAQMQLLTAKLQPKDLSALKKLMLRPGFVEEWNSLDSLAAGFAKVLMNKANATPSMSYKLFTSYDPEAVLWLGFTTKDKAIKDRYDLFLKTWPEARQRIPHALMQEMRITPELAGYNDIVHQLFLQLIDGNLNTPEEMRAFLEPHSPPAPPPTVTIKRTRTRRSAEAKVKERAFDEDEEADAGEEDEDLDDIGGGDEEEMDLGLSIPKGEESEGDLGEEGEEEEEAKEEEEEATSRQGKRGAKPAAAGKKPVTPTPAKAAAPHAEPKHGKTLATKPSAGQKAPVAAHARHEAKHPVTVKHSGKHNGKAEKEKPASNHHAPAKKAAHPVKPVAKAQVKATKTTVKHAAKSHSKAPAKPSHNHAHGKNHHANHVKAGAKSHSPAKAGAKKPAHKAGKKH